VAARTMTYNRRFRWPAGANTAAGGFPGEAAL